MEYLPLYLKAVLALFIIFVLPGLLVVRFLKIDELPQRWLAVFLSSVVVNHVAIVLIAAVGAKPAVIYAGMVPCLFVALVILELRRPKFMSAASEIRSSDLFWLIFSLIVLGATYSEIWQRGVPAAFEAPDVSGAWNGWALGWAEGLFPNSYGYPQFVSTIWSVAYVVTGSQLHYFAFHCYLVLIVAPLTLTAMVLGRLHWWLPLVQFAVFVCFIAGVIEPNLRTTLAHAFPDWVVVVFSFAGVAAFLSQRPPHQRSFTILLLALCLECVAAATKPVVGLVVIAFALASCVDAVRHIEDRKLRMRIILAVVGLVSLFAIIYWISNFTYLTGTYAVAARRNVAAPAWEKFSTGFSLAVRILCLSGLFLSLVLPRARWLALPLFAGILIWADRTSYDIRNAFAFVLIAALIPVDALARRTIKSDLGAFGRQWILRDTTVAASALVVLLLVSLPMAKPDKQLEAQFETDQFRLGVGPILNQAVARQLRAGCTLFTVTKYFMQVVSLQAYKSQINFFYYGQPIGDDGKADDGTNKDYAMHRKNAMDTQRDFEAVEGCVAVLFAPTAQEATGLAFLRGYFQRRQLSKIAEANQVELWSSNHELR
jgi:hypothetical protein